MNIRKILCNIFCEQKTEQEDVQEDELCIEALPYPQQESTDRVLASSITDLLNDSSDGLNMIKTGMYITDRTFKSVDTSHLADFLLENPVSERKYVNERHDCDDFAYILQGDVTRWDSDLSFGIVHGRTPTGVYHAWNVCIGTDNKVWFIEPQTDMLWKPVGDWQIYLVVM